jgi:hypothetical protein
MNSTKPWYSSAGIWGALVSMFVGIAGVFHLHPDAQWATDATQWLVTLGSLIGGAMALWGRIRATRQIATPGTPPAAMKLLAAGLLLAALSGCASGTSATTQPSAPDSTQQLTIATDTAAFTLDGVAKARDAGLVTQAEIDNFKPYIDALIAARARAETQLRAGNTDGFTAAVSDIQAAYVQLEPLMSQISRGRPATKPAGGQ